jgi:ferredoxin
VKVSIDTAKCVGHGMCRLAAPEIFDLSDDDGHGFVLMEEVPPGLEEAVEQAQRGCPEDAVIITRN